MLNWIKKTAIQLTDKINTMHDPFDEFTRPIIRRTADTLAAKERAFAEQMRSDFLLPSGVYTYKRQRDSLEPLDLGDQALWHGIYTATWAMKARVTQDPADRAVALASLQAMTNHHRNGKLIRGVDQLGHFADDCSNDSLTGHLAGIFFSWILGDAETRATAKEVMRPIYEELMNNNMALVRQDGTPTTYGVLIDGWKTDPLRLSLCIAALSLSYDMYGFPNIAETRRKLLAQYGEILGFPKVKFLWWNKQYDTHRAALHLVMCAHLAQEPWMIDRCAWGLERIWDMEHKAQDPWLAGLVDFGRKDPARKAVATRLHEYEVQERGLEVERLNTVRKDYWKTIGVRFLVWDDKWRASQPLPFWMIGSQDFFPQRELFSADNWQGQTDQRLRYNGGDFLASYWIHRLKGTIGAED